MDNRIELAKQLYPEEYQKAIELSYPDKYIYIGCKWLHDWKASDTALKFWFNEWDKYVRDKEDIESMKNSNELAWCVFDYKEYGHRKTDRKSVLQI